MRQTALTIATIWLLTFCNSVLARKWTDITGSFSVEATLVEVKEEKAFLKKVDGSIIDVPLEKLSKADREFIENQNGKKAAATNTEKPTETAGIASKTVKPIPKPTVPDSEPKSPAELLTGGKNWKSVKAMSIGDQKWESGAELWIWPDNDEVVRRGEDGKLHIRFQCQLQPGKKRPDRLVPSVVILARKKSGDGSVITQAYDPYLKAPELPTNEPLEASFSFDAKELSGSGTVHFFLTSGGPRRGEPRDKKILVYSNLIEINCVVGKGE